MKLDTIYKSFNLVENFAFIFTYVHLASIPNMSDFTLEL